MFHYRDSFHDFDSIYTKLDLRVSSINSDSLLIFCRPWDLCGYIGGAFVFLAYVTSLVNVIRILYLCATVEPGIIPKIRSKTVNYTKPYKIKYREAHERATAVKDLSPVEAFFSLSSFKLAEDQALDPPLTETLSYCRTC